MISLVLLVLGLALCGGVVPPNELRALLDINRQGWIKSTGWGIGDPCDNKWFGIQCTSLDLVNTTIISVDLDSNGLYGTIPLSIGEYLLNLQRLSLHGNHMVGIIPDNLGNLTYLRILALNDNDFNGTFPDIGKLSQLTLLDFGGNSLVGTIPEFIGSYTRIQTFLLDANDFNGTIPTAIGNLTGVLKINLGKNSLSGTFPTEFVKLSLLKELNLGSNSLKGPIPSELSSLSHLTTLDLSFNGLNGTITSNLAALSNLIYLNFAYNALTGTIPTQIGYLTNIQTLIIENNKITGTIPTQIASLVLLESIDISTNKLSGSIPQTIALMRYLTSFIVSSNNICDGCFRFYRSVKTCLAQKILTNCTCPTPTCGNAICPVNMSCLCSGSQYGLGICQGGSLVVNSPVINVLNIANFSHIDSMILYGDLSMESLQLSSSSVTLNGNFNGYNSSLILLDTKFGINGDLNFSLSAFYVDTHSTISVNGSVYLSTTIIYLDLQNQIPDKSEIVIISSQNPISYYPTVQILNPPQSCVSFQNQSRGNQVSMLTYNNCSVLTEIIGGVIGGVFILVVVPLVCFLIHKKKQSIHKQLQNLRKKTAEQ